MMRGSGNLSNRNVESNHGTIFPGKGLDIRTYWGKCRRHPHRELFSKVCQLRYHKIRSSKGLLNGYHLRAPHIRVWWQSRSPAPDYVSNM